MKTGSHSKRLFKTMFFASLLIVFFIIAFYRIGYIAGKDKALRDNARDSVAVANP